MSKTVDLIVIKSAIARSGKYKKHLAARIGMTPTNFSRCLSGKRNFGNAALILLMSELNLKPEALLQKAS